MSYNPVSCLSDNISIDKTKCIGCSKCVDRCVLDNLRLKQAPCFGACPLEINAQGYVQLIARGDVEGALNQIYERTPFAGILGNICNHPCETECNRNKVDEEAVTIRALKKYLYNKAKDYKPDTQKAASKPEKVAVIGAGPAGMMAAWDLAKEGYEVTIFDESPQAGGMLTKVIPDFRLNSAVVENEAAYLQAVGVDLRLNTAVDMEAFTNIVNNYAAVFIAVGAKTPIKLQNENIEGVCYALDFLAAAKRHEVKAAKNVIVVGGGDVAIDSAMTALRIGAENVKIISLEGYDSLPATKESITDAEREGIEFKCGFGIKDINVKDGAVKSIVIKNCQKVFDETGKFNPVFDDNITAEIDAEMVILAIGQKSELAFLDGVGVEIENGRIKVNDISLQTSNEKIFAGGDVIAGANTAVNAMADGKRAAESIIKYIQGDDITYGRNEGYKCITDFEVDLTAGSKEKRLNLINSDTSNQLEAELTDDEAKTQAERCLNCGSPVGYRKTCWMCLPCEVECPYEALTVNVHYIMA